MKIKEIKQIKTTGDQGKQLIEANALITGNNFDIERDDVPTEKQQKVIFNKLIEERDYEFDNLENEINSNNLIYEFKTE